MRGMDCGGNVVGILGLAGELAGLQKSFIRNDDLADESDLFSRIFTLLFLKLKSELNSTVTW